MGSLTNFNIGQMFNPPLGTFSGDWQYQQLQNQSNYALAMNQQLFQAGVTADRVSAAPMGRVGPEEAWLDRRVEELRVRL